MLSINNRNEDTENEDMGENMSDIKEKSEIVEQINFGDYGDVESFRVIFIPSNQNIQPYEVSISTKESIQTQLDNIINTKNRVSEYISKKDTSHIIFPLVDSGTSGFLANPRASDLLRRKKSFLGDALFINFRKIYRDISLEEFFKIEKFISKNIYVQDFENICKINDHDLVSLITKKSTFQVDKDSSQALYEINFKVNDIDFEYKPIVEKLKPAGPFYSHFSIEGISFFSKILPQKALSINSLSNRVLMYLIWRQQKLLFGCDQQYIDTSEQEHRLEHEQFLKDNVKTKKDNEETSMDITTSTSTATTETDVEFKDITKPKQTDVKFKDISSTPASTTTTTTTTTTTIINNNNNNDNNKEDEEIIELYGIKIKKNHSVISIKDKEIYKHVIKAGNGTVFPTIGNSIVISFSTRLPNGKIIQEKQKQTIIIGETNCIIGIHYALTSMSPGEHSIVVLDPQYAYGELGLPGLITPHTKLIVLIEASNQFDTTEKSNNATLIRMSTPEKINAIRSGSDLAKNNFNSKRFGRSLRDYKSLENYYNLDYLPKVSQEEWDDIQSLATSNCINIAIVYSKLNRWDRTFHYLKLAMEYDEDSPKIHYWLSKCYKNGQNYEGAIKEIQLAQKIDSESPTPKMSNHQYNKELDHLNKLLANQELNERKMYKRIFDNLHEDDDNQTTEINKMEDDLLFTQGNSENKNIDITADSNN
ncbi:hypothetical protein ACTFIY_008227 [Dictyostelium cf. discoideum]